MHIPDIFVVKPIFWQDRVRAFAVSTAHHLDLGGRVPGSSATDNTEIFQEGLRLPWLKLFDKGEPNQAIFDIIRANVRVPHMTLGDLNAQLAACHIGERGVLELIERYGADAIEAYAADLIDYTERLVRAEIDNWPDGRHHFVDHLDSDGVGGPPVRLEVAIEIRGDTLRADFTGSDPQVRGAINNTLSFTHSVVALCVRGALGEEIPNTAGMFRPLEINAPPGTVVNGVMPAASSMRGVTGFRLVDTVMGALAGLLPKRIPAAGEGGNSLVIIGGHYPDRSPYVYYELMSGTWGAPRPRRQRRPLQPRQRGQQHPHRGGRGNYPVRIERYGLVRDSGGPGRFRDGLAVEREWHLLEGEAHLAIRSDRRDHLPYGLYDGQPGGGSTNILHSGEDEEVLPTMISTRMVAGQRLYHRQPGGGWARPLRPQPRSRRPRRQRGQGLAGAGA